MLKSKFIGVFLTIALAVGLAGCGVPAAEKDDGQKDAAAAKPVYEIRIPDVYSPLYNYEPYVADALGIFEKYGVKLVYTGVISPGQHVAAVVAGTNDVGTLHVNRTIAGINAGAKLKMVVAGTESSKERPHMSYIVLDNSPIKTAKDLLGKKIGVVAVGGCHEYTPYAWLEQNGISNPKGKITFVTVPAGTEEQALRSGEIDCYGSMSYPEDIVSRGNIRVLFDDVDIWGTVGGATPWYFRQDFIDKNPDAVRAFVNAIAETQAWMNKNPEGVAEIMGKRWDVEPERVSVMHYADKGIIKEDSVQIWLDILTHYGELTKTYKATDLYTNEFNDFAKNN